jgi:hypothetical protein
MLRTPRGLLVLGKQEERTCQSALVHARKTGRGALDAHPSEIAEFLPKESPEDQH